MKSFSEKTRIDLFDKVSQAFKSAAVMDRVDEKVAAEAIDRSVEELLADAEFMEYRSLGVVNGIGQGRKALPSIYNYKLSFPLILKWARSIIGKNLSKFKLPVFMHEPASELQKCGEFMYL